jgi:hypothetical protein
MIYSSSLLFFVLPFLIFSSLLFKSLTFSYLFSSLILSSLILHSDSYLLPLFFYLLAATPGMRNSLDPDSRRDEEDIWNLDFDTRPLPKIKGSNN